MQNEPQESGARGIDRHAALPAAAYVVAVAVHTVLVVMGLALLSGYRIFGYGLMGLLAAAFLAPVLFGWVVVVGHVVKRVRAGRGFPPHIRKLIRAPILIALVAFIFHITWAGVPYRLRHPWAEKRAFQAEYWLERVVEQDLRRFHYKYGHFPEDLEDLADEWWEGWDPADVYGDPFTGPREASTEPLHYVRLAPTNALFYSIGPDLDDDKGEKEFTEDQLRYHKDCDEWRGMPFGDWLYERYDVSAKLDGDITRRLSFGESKNVK
jgi:hypothetical protein